MMQRSYSNLFLGAIGHLSVQMLHMNRSENPKRMQLSTDWYSVQTAIGINAAVTPWRFVDIPLAPHPKRV